MYGIESNIVVQIAGKSSFEYEKKLDIYEDFPNTYIKRYFKILGKKVMFYYMPKKTMHVPPSKRYINLIIQGYKDCGYKNNYIVISRNKKIKVKWRFLIVLCLRRRNVVRY